MFVFVKRLNTHMHMCIYVTTGTKRTSISQEKNLHGAVIMSVLFCFFLVLFLSWAEKCGKRYFKFNKVVSIKLK